MIVTGWAVIEVSQHRLARLAGQFSLDEGGKELIGRAGPDLFTFGGYQTQARDPALLLLRDVCHKGDLLHS
jgi:hypothetical protein